MMRIITTFKGQGFPTKTRQTVEKLTSLIDGSIFEIYFFVTEVRNASYTGHIWTFQILFFFFIIIQ